MTQKIIYTADDGMLMIIHPTPEILETKTIEEVAQKDVPNGKPYKIIEITDLPSDRTFRDAWEVDESTLTDGIGAEHNMFIDDPLHPDYVAEEITE